MSWAVVQRVWCLWCGIREENGKGADLCAQCQGEIHNVLKEAVDG